MGPSGCEPRDREKGPDHDPVMGHSEPLGDACCDGVDGCQHWGLIYASIPLGMVKARIIFKDASRGEGAPKIRASGLILASLGPRVSLIYLMGFDGEYSTRVR